MAAACSSLVSFRFWYAINLMLFLLSFSLLARCENVCLIQQQCRTYCPSPSCSSLFPPSLLHLLRVLSICSCAFGNYQVPTASTTIKYNFRPAQMLPSASCPSTFPPFPWESRKSAQDKSFTIFIFIFYLSSSTFEDMLKDPFGSGRKTQSRAREVEREKGAGRGAHQQLLWGSKNLFCYLCEYWQIRRLHCQGCLGNT